ncbi:sensor histidine kinase [uncultured Jatrophihabitans sp.]|uniref:sensor histidine kinase n=1 Tax=uncultured Jatrophihabitans sp. TaxID=1610747 RepID=UPI0035CC8103
MASEQSRTRVFSAPRRVQVDEHASSLQAIALACCGLAGVDAAVVLLGWAINEPGLERVAPGLAVMRFNTAVCLLALAVAFAIPRRAAAGRAVATIGAGVAGVLAGLQLAEWAFGIGLGVDQLVVTDPGSGPHPGRSSAAVATCVLLLAAASLTTGRRRAWRRTRQALLLAPAAVAWLALVGYAYDAQSLTNLGSFFTIALHTALAIVLLSIAGLASTRRGRLEWVLFSEDAGGALSRRLAPMALVGLPFIGLACLAAHRLSWINDVTMVALTVVLCTLAFGAATWTAATRVARLDNARRATLADLTQLKQGLELQVAARAEQLRSRHDEIAVLEDRQRIAADIHDVVIQRLFAAGMFLHGTPTSEAIVQERIGSAIESMDAAIRDLRNSIFELGGNQSRVLDLATAVDDICTDAARVLGFRPDVLVDDPDREADTVRDDLLAVVRESLSNVARHASASSVDVVLRTGHGLISLTVTDDGTGMTSTPHSSGTRNMAERARRRGGDCVWTTVEPHGTRVWWHVPGTPSDLVLEPAADDIADDVADDPAPDELADEPADEPELDADAASAGLGR